MPSLFPPLDSFFPLELINIVSKLPLVLQSQSPSSIPLASVIVSISSENQLKLRFDNLETSPTRQSSYSNEKPINPFLIQLTLHYYDSPASNNLKNSIENQDDENFWTRFNLPHQKKYSTIPKNALIQINCSQRKSFPVNHLQLSTPTNYPLPKKYLPTPLTGIERIDMLDKCREKETTPRQLNREKIIL